jgi:hypothetical protein
MKILITGATGFIGQPLVSYLEKQGNIITILTRRNVVPRNANIRYAVWNSDDVDSVVPEVDGIDAIINLAGESIAAKRWTKQQKEKILSSRINATRVLVQSIEQAKQKPKVLINASAVGYYGSDYGHRIGERRNPVTDESSPAAKEGFLAQVAQAWEREAMCAEKFGVRVVCLRIGMVLEKTGGALGKILPIFRAFLGGPIGNGKQWTSWIYLDDLVRLIEFSIMNGNVRGAINATSPEPVTNQVFSQTLARALKRPCWLPVPAFVLRAVMGEMASVVLDSKRVFPMKALELGFKFQYPGLYSAIESILGKSKSTDEKN